MRYLCEYQFGYKVILPLFFSTGRVSVLSYVPLEVPVSREAKSMSYDVVVIIHIAPR